ncbi:sulfatase-like hydrolase/transferase [Leptospira sp. 201903070]|uniref:Sulfatase-like hydrolase/transferase n=1 Tax=Leptospira ainlahdjerensis TaxID=2810033 RepID=A0ABS2UG92_9LEPT|nr:sulfatase [Leptospira ainlahdjerensis]MBM9579396.1 sulfatase-like hydrolase/transferase [Leptospira ainlahdjerensis]
MFSSRAFFDHKRFWNRSIFLLVLLNCNPIPETERNVVKGDLTRLLKNSDFVCSGDTNRDIEKFRTHWKKNPGRYSGLDPKDRWKNVQLTLYVDETLFINESQDSLFIPSGEECSLKMRERFSTSNSAFFQFYATILSQGFGGSAPGQLQILEEDKEILSYDFKIQKEEWKKFSLPLNSKKLNEHSVFKIKWKSKNGSGLFLGSPVLLEKEKTKKQNVILIVIDALRQDALSSGGSPFPTTPILDSLSKDSIVFQNTIANGNWTKPSMLSFFTSEVASNLGLGNAWFYTSGQQRKIFYSKKPATLPNKFRDEGYFTESIMNNVFLMDYTSVGVDLGFHKIQQVGKDTLDTEELVSRTEIFFREHKDDLFFLHLNLNTPHWGYRPPVRYFQELKDQADPRLWKNLDEYQQKYLGEVRYTDALLGRIFEELKKQELFENSWIVVTSDHGELLEKSHYYHHHFITETVYAHGETHYEKEIRVPWIIHPPKSFHGQIRKKEFPGQVSLLSLMPTLLGLNGIEYEKEKLKGNDYSKAIFGKDGPEFEPVIYTEGRYSESIQTQNFKYLRRYPGYDTVRRTREGIPHKMPEELYDLKSDPNELSNIVEKKPKLLSEARNILKENQLDKNVFTLRLPKCENDCEREIRFFSKGGIYRFDFTGEAKVIGEDSKNLNLFLPKESNRFEQTLSVKTVDVTPIFRLQILKDGKSEDFRVGKWGIRSNAAAGILAAVPDNVSLGRIPYRYASSKIPFLYYHTGFSGGKESAEEAAMGKEVRKILESWGYIHQ